MPHSPPLWKPDSTSQAPMLRLRVPSTGPARHRRQPRLPRCRRNHHPDYTVTITDNNNDTDTDTVQVTITGTNDAPQISAAIADFGFTEDAKQHKRRLSPATALSPSQTSTTTLSSMSAQPSPPMPSGAAAPSMPHSPPLWKPDSTSQAPMLRLTKVQSTGPTPSPTPTSTSSMPAKPSP